MDIRATKLAEKALKSNAQWVTELGPPPGNKSRKKVWMDTVSMVAAYRDYWNIGDHPCPLGSEEGVTTLVQTSQRVKLQQRLDQIPKLNYFPLQHELELTAREQISY